MKHRILLIALAASVCCSCDDIFEKDISKEKMEVVSPVDGAQALQGEVVFLWKAVDGADTYRVTIVSPSFDKPAQVVADTTVNGGLSIMADMAPGNYQWSVRGINSGYSTVEKISSFKVITPDKDISHSQVQALSPLAVATEGDVVFSWYALEGASHYRLTVTSPSFVLASSVVADTMVDAGTLSVGIKMIPGKYQWNVKGINTYFTSRDNIRDLQVASSDKDISGNKIEIISPGTSATAGNIAFVWRALDGAAAYRATVVSPSFDNPACIEADTVITGDKLSFVLKLAAGQYQWGIRAENGTYKTVEQRQSLNVTSVWKDISNDKVRIISPLDNVTAQPGETVFLWRELEGATAYRITIVSPSFANASKVIADKLITDGSLSFSQIIEPGAYQWCISAYNPAYTTQEQVYNLNIAIPEPEPEQPEEP